MDTDRTSELEPDPDAGSGISCQHQEDATYITLWGEVDAALREAASDAMSAVVSRPAQTPLAVDARDVTFLDSSGVAFILQLYMLGQETGAPVHLLEPSEAVTEVLEMIGMGGRIPIKHEEQHAGA
ncbi:STAS domain-containing protein [Isoptericola dokdonensis]|jgi:anti-anti-sigma factor|uniref:Anti-sigma factor antagonist n=1 Tax=Isoptericola dokdonensis DS-3 TaxID=1300344 RepID=A0A161IFB0_9MICO|nr:STAS domain-containing protein [Isoptericola dokdonensis]ANC32107.1 STAS domain protein [Isoptericola dokdonensis DS-3]